LTYKVADIRERKNHLKRLIRRKRKELENLEDELQETLRDYKAKKQSNQGKRQAKQSILDRVRKGDMRMTKKMFMKILLSEKEDE